MTLAALLSSCVNIKVLFAKYRPEGLESSPGEKCLHGVGVASLMKKLSLTVGGFYKHFNSRDELVAEALPAAAVGSDLVTGAITKATKQLIFRNNQGLITSD
jgi:Bacterial regulatory proteins, tetR family